MPERCVAALCNNVNDQENNIGLHRRFLNLRHRHQSRGHFEHVILVISGRGRPQENRILNFVKIREKIAFYPNRNFFSQKLIRWNVELDERKKSFDIMSTLRSRNNWKYTLINWYTSGSCKWWWAMSGDLWPNFLIGNYNETVVLYSEMWTLSGIQLLIPIIGFMVVLIIIDREL